MIRCALLIQLEIADDHGAPFAECSAAGTSGIRVNPPKRFHKWCFKAPLCDYDEVILSGKLNIAEFCAMKRYSVVKNDKKRTFE